MGDKRERKKEIERDEGSEGEKGGKERSLAKDKMVRLAEKILSQFYNSCCLVEPCSFGHSLTGSTENTHPMQLSCI